MNELLGLAAALASLVALACWARTVPTRAWGDDTPTGAARWRAKAVALGTLLLQTTTASLAAGWVAGVALVLAMNLWPQASQRWALRLGGLGLGGCVLALVACALGEGLLR